MARPRCLKLYWRKVKKNGKTVRLRSLCMKRQGHWFGCGPR
jgi:hypothetical protein